MTVHCLHGPTSSDLEPWAAVIAASFITLGTFKPRIVLPSQGAIMYFLEREESSRAAKFFPGRGIGRPNLLEH